MNPIKIKRIKIGGGVQLRVDCIVDDCIVEAVLDTGANVTVADDSLIGKDLSIGGFFLTMYQRLPKFVYEQHKSSRYPTPRILIGMDILDRAVINLKDDTLVLK